MTQEELDIEWDRLRVEQDILDATVRVSYLDTLLPSLAELRKIDISGDSACHVWYDLGEVIGRTISVLEKVTKDLDKYKDIRDGKGA